MSSLLHRSWDILSQHLPKASLPLPLILLLTTPNLQAIHDTNQNNVSDLWEKKFNSGALYPTFIPTADPDGDGWTNAQEAAAGTDPGSGVPPIGHLNPTVTYTPTVYLSPAQPGGEPEILTPEAATITWPTLAGKKYTLLFSPDLESGTWIQIGSPRIGAGTEIGTSIALTQPDGSTPPRGFWRVTINDVDTDSDTLTNAEEHELGTNPNSADTDGDGLSDMDELLVHHTNPNSRDSDDDGVPDDIEIRDGTNPNSSSSHGPVIKTVERELCMEFRGYKNPPDGSLGITRSWVSPAFSATELTTRIAYAALGAKLVAEAPFPETIPKDFQFETYQKVEGYSITENVAPVASPLYYAALIQRRMWLQIAPAAAETIQRSYLRVTERSDHCPIPGFDDTGDVHVTIERVDVTIPQGKTESSPFDLLCELNGTGGLPHKTTSNCTRDEIFAVEGVAQYLLPVDIKPDANMAGVVEDVVKSAKAGSTVEHFVTPKKSTELNQDYVELKAVGVDTATFSKLLEWEGGEAGSTADKRKVKRDTAGKTEVKIKVKQGGAVAAQMNVWVTWADLTLEDNTPKIQPAVDNGQECILKGKISYRYVCIPNAMFDKTQDIPNLNSAPDPQAPGGNHPWPQHEALANGASIRYDATRQVRAILKSSDHLVLGVERQAGYSDIPDFPQDIDVGNDDPNMGGELTPYDGEFGTQGVMRDIDSPIYFLKHDRGLPDSTFSLNAQFRQYARIQLAGKWFCCSDLKLSDLKLKFKKTNGKWSDDGSTFITGNGPFQTP